MNFRSGAAAVFLGSFLLAAICHSTNANDGRPSTNAPDAALNPSLCHPKALVTDDNDIRLGSDDKREPGRPVELPAPVLRQFQLAAGRFLAARRPTEDVKSCTDLFPHTYRISLAKPRELFVSEIAFAPGLGRFFLLVFDRATGKVTQHPKQIEARWPQQFGATDPLVKKPLVSSVDLFANGHPQIVFEERVHNGNMYNGIVYHYFDIDPDLELTEILARETRVPFLNREGWLIVRDLVQIAPGRLRFNNFLVLQKHPQRQENLGYAILESRGPRVPFHVVERHPTNPSAFDSLITVMDQPPDDDDFLRGGKR